MQDVSPAERDAGGPAPGPPPRNVAVIDIGSASIRMAIAQIDGVGHIQTLESLQREIHLGKDTFTKGSIESATIEECVGVFRGFRRVLLEYGVTDNADVRAVATSAVREAANRDSFLDRIYIATGIRIEAIDEAEVHRLTYLVVLPVIEANPRLRSHSVLVAEVGGGSTELLLLESGTVAYSGTYRLGAVRMHEMLRASRTPAARTKKVLQTHIHRTMEQIQLYVGARQNLRLVALGGDARFAVNQLETAWNKDEPACLQVEALAAFTDGLLKMTVDEIVRSHHVTFHEAESLGPALLTLVMLAQALELDHVHVASITLRDGLLKEMAVKDSWTKEFKKQVVQSALDLGRRFQFDESHGTHVAQLSLHFFRALQDLHMLESRYELLLHIAALLHELGMSVSTRSHHKHSMYLISNSELFGLGGRDLLLVALVARYHRRAAPIPTHTGYAGLDRDSRIVVCKLAAILRVADALDRAHVERIHEMDCTREGHTLVITLPGVEDVTLENLALKEKGSLFEQVFGLTVRLRPRAAGGPDAG